MNVIIVPVLIMEPQYNTMSNAWSRPKIVLPVPEKMLEFDSGIKGELQIERSYYSNSEYPPVALNQGRCCLILVLTSRSTLLSYTNSRISFVFT